MSEWLSLVTSLPTENAALRQRTWRALKATGAAVLRDGVYLMPAGAGRSDLLQRLGSDVRAGGGTALLLEHGEPPGANFEQRFDRGELYAGLLEDTARARESLSAATADGVRKQARKLRRTFDSIAGIDFFPGEPQRRAGQALESLERACARATSADEPADAPAAIRRLAPADYVRRTWATRRRPWVDRLASAWLVRRFIDPQASILWLAHPDHCPPEAVGFDFDGAEFSHAGGLVTFEILAQSFGLTATGLAGIAGLVHCLDVGGPEPPEAAGVEAVLGGLRNSIADDDALLAAASVIFDGLLAAAAGTAT